MYYPNKKQAFETAIHHLRHILMNSVGTALGGTIEEEELRRLMVRILSAYPDNGRIHIDYEPFIAENFVNTDPVELKRMLKSKHEK